MRAKRKWSRGIFFKSLWLHGFKEIVITVAITVIIILVLFMTMCNTHALPGTSRKYLVQNINSLDVPLVLYW